LPWLFAPSEQTHVPMLMWLSDGFGASRGIDRACLEQRRHESHSHDHLFHSVLGLFDVATRIYQPELDLFRPCRAPESQMFTGR
jgi:lipid A ethanolaminephosphotransferase